MLFLISLATKHLSLTHASHRTLFKGKSPRQVKHLQALNRQLVDHKSSSEKNLFIKYINTIPQITNVCVCVYIYLRCKQSELLTTVATSPYDTIAG